MMLNTIFLRNKLFYWNFILLLFILTFLVLSKSNGQTWNYSYSFGSTNTSEMASRCFLDTAGNAYYFLKYGNTVDFDPSGGVTNLTSKNNGGSSIFPTPAFVKMSSAGTLNFAVNTVNDSGGANINSGINFDKSVSDGTYVYAVGYCQGAVTINGTKIMSTTDFYVIKASLATGAIVWYKVFGTASGLETPGSITLDNSGNLYISGCYNSITANGTTYTVPAGGTDVDLFVMKMAASDGTVSWVTTGGTNTQDGNINTTSSIVYNPKYNKLTLFATVGVSGSASSRAFTMGGQSATTGTGLDMFIADVNMSTGSFNNMSYFGSAANESFMSAGYDVPTGDVIVGGSYGSSLTLSGSISLSSPSSTQNCWTARYNPNTSSFIWAKSLPHTSYNLTSSQLNGFRSIASNNSGAVFAAANYDGSMTVNGTTYTSNGGSDYAVVRYNVADGDVEWITTAGSSSTSEYMIGVASDSVGRFLLTGMLGGNISVDGRAITLQSTAADFFIMQGTMPTVKTRKSSTPTSTTVTLNGTVVTAAGGTISATGFVYGTSPAPKTTTASVVTTGTSIGTISQGITGLTPNTTYYARAYLTTEKGTFYGQQDTFTTAAGAVNTSPTFVSTSPQTLTVCQNSSATDIKTLLRASDVDASQTLTWTVQSAPSNGTVTLSSATASSGSTTITPGGTCTYQPTAGYSGSDAFTVRVSDGTASADMVINVTVNPSPDAGTLSAASDNFYVCNTAFRAATTTGVAGGVWSSSNTSVATINSSTGTVGGAIPGGTSTISYTVTSSGCTSVATRVFTVYPYSDTGIVSGNLSYCVGGTGVFTTTSTTRTSPFSYAWSSSATSIATINSSTGNLTALAAGTARITYTTAGCGTFRAFRTVTVSATPTISITGSPSVAAGSTTADMSFTTAGSPTLYTIDYDATANTAGFVDITSSTSLPSSPLTLAIPVGASVGTYNGTITVSNANCSSTATAFTITLTSANTAPAYTLSSPRTLTVCKNASATDIKSLLHVNDPDASQTLTWTLQSSPTNGTISIASATAATGSSDITPDGTITYQPTTGYSGSDAFTIRVTDGTATADMVVNVTVVGVTPSIASQNNVSCNGGSNGRAVINVTGGTAPYTYSWAPAGGTTATASGLTAGSYTCTVTDNNSCSSTQVVTITQPSVLNATISSQTNVACNGGSNGMAVVNATGGTTSYSYSWAPAGGTTATASGLTAGSYTCTVTDANFCSTTVVATITQPSALSASIASQTNVSCNGGSNGIAAVNATGGAGGYSYSWAPAGGTAATASGLAAGSYTCTVTDANLCTSTTVATITQPTAISSNISSQTNILCYGDSTGSAVVNVTGGTSPYTYSWSPAGGTTATGTNLYARTFTCTITDNNGCTKTQTATITQPSFPVGQGGSATNVSCNGGSNGVAISVVSGGTAPYTYAWSPSVSTTATASGLSAGTYTCTATDANGCHVSRLFFVSQPSAIVLGSGTVTNATCGSSNGSAVVTATGGTGSYTYAWSPSGGSTATGSNLGAGVYTVTVTDANSCTATRTFTITVPAGVSLSLASQNNVSCNGVSNGRAVVSTTGGTAPFTYSWAPSGGATATASGLTAGTYTCTVTDNNSCSSTQIVTITQPAVLSASISATTNVSCNGGSNGSLATSVTGGTTPYTYSWSPAGGTSATASGLTAGTYTCTITDDNSCSTTVSGTITQPSTLTLAAGSVTNVSCNGGSNGSAVAVASGGTTPYTYSWSPSGGTTATASGISAGTYTCTVTDNNSCTATRTFTVTQPSAITSSVASVTNVACNGGNTGEASITASGGTGTLSYAWAPSGGNANSASSLSAGTYTVTITDDNVCSRIQTVTVTQPSAITSSIASATNVLCNGGSNGSAVVSASGGTGTLSYSWAPAGGTTATASGLTAGTYTCTITDDNLCSRIQTVTITQPTALSASLASQNNVSCNAGSNGRAVVTATGGTLPYTYSWAPAGGSTATASGLTAGTYTCTVTDANSCETTQTVTITQPAALSVNSGTITDVTCNGGNNGSAVAVATGGTIPYTYSWSPSGGTTATGSNLTAGTYTCTVTDNNSCSASHTFTIAQPSTITSSVASITNVLCNGGSTGEAEVTASGGTGALSYSWAPAGGTSSSASGLTAGTYSVTITDANSCVRVQTLTVTQPAILTTSVASQTNVSCNGGSNGRAVVAASGGAGSYTYAWSPSGGTTATASGLSAGTYTCTVTDANLCVKTQTVTITEPATLVASSASQTNVTCNSGSDGVAVVGVTGGTLPYTYSWAPAGGSTATASGLSLGSYTCTVTDANSCEAQHVFAIMEPAAIAVSITGATTICYNTSSNVVITATPGVTVSYNINGGSTLTALMDADGDDTISTGNITANATYNLVSVTEGSCTYPKSGSTTVSVYPNTTVDAITSQTVCNDASTTAINFTGAVSGTTYNWTNNTTSIGLAASGTGDIAAFTATNTGTSPVVATVTVTPTANGCVGASKTFSVTVNPTPDVTVPSSFAVCNNVPTGNMNFSSSVSGTTYSWTNTNTAIGLAASGTGSIGSFTATNSTTDPIEAVITVTPSANSCGGAAQSYTVTVNPTPVLTSTLTLTPVCDNGSVSYTPTTLTSGTSFAWSRAAVIGIANSAATGTNGFAESLDNNGTATATVSYVYTLTANGCSNVETVSVDVYPTPVLTSTLTPASICNLTTFSYAPTSATSGTTFSWSRAAVAGITNSASSGSNNPNETLENTTADPIAVDYVYTLTANGCTNVETVTVIVNPGPLMSSTLTPAAICDSTLFSYVPTSATSGTVFNWSRASVSGISNTAATGTGNPSEYLNNTSTAPVTVTYVYTLTASGCSGIQNVSVVVNPTPELTSTLTPAAQCNNTLFTYVPISATTGTAFEWSRASVSGISNSAATGTDGISEVLVNTSTAPVTVTYVYTLTANNCTNIQNVSVVVNPTPVLTSTLTANAQCNNNIFSYTPTSATSGTAFAWSRASVTDISNVAATGTNNPNETLINTGTEPATVTYVYTLTANGCSNTQNVTVTVNPTPVLTSTLTLTPVCDNGSVSYTPTTLTSGTSFAWSRAAVIGIANSAATGTNGFAESLDNNGTATATVSYVYTLTANGCSNVETVSVDVYPTPVLTSTLTPASICNLTTFSYAPTSATSGTTFSWSRAAVAGITNSASSGSNNPNETLENTTADPVAVDYVYTLTANGCTNVETVTVTVNPGPLMSSTLTPAAICDSTLFSYVPTSATSGTVFNWSRASVSGISNTTATGTGNPSEYLNNTSTAPVTVTYVYTLTASGCSGIQNVSVVVNPTPELTSTLTPAAQCNNTLFTYVPTSATTGTAFEWSRASVSGISNSAAIGTDGISEVLVNTSTDPVTVTYVYTLTANNCTNIQNVSVVVNPTPVLTSTLTADPICDNTTFNYTPTSATLGTAFSWSRAALTGISNAASGGNDNPAEILNNTTTAPITVTYVYTLTANGCSNLQNVSVVVNPTPVLSSTLTPDAICDSATFSYVPTSATTGTAFSWSRDAVTGIANSANTGINNPNENLYNTTVDPITVTYVYTLTANNCSNIQSVDVVVNPTPVLTSTLTADPICSNTTFDYTPKSATAGTTFNWSRAAITGISNLAATGSDNPTETLVNTTTDPITVTYVYTLTANGCNHIQNVTVVVNPSPKFTSTETPTAICDSTLFSYVPTSATVGTTFAWSRLSVAGIANTDATGTNNPNEYLNNTSVSPVTVIYTYTLTANGCDNVQSVSVVVNPTPELTSTLTPTAVCNNTTFHYAPTSATLGTVFSWNRATVAGISNVANSGTGDIDEVLVNTTSDPVTVQYVYTLSANTCDNIQTVSVVVYPTPVLTTTLVAAPVCDSSLFSYTPNSATFGTTFAWSRAVVAGISNATAIGTDNPNEYLKNTIVNPVTVTYVYILTANGCNNTQNVDVTVYPTPVLSSTLTPDAICDSALFSYLPTSATTGTTFSWSRAFVAGISNAANTGTDNPNETLYNTTSLPISVDYIYTLTANGCNHTQTVSVLVNPTPVLSSTLTPSAICNNTTFSYIPMSATSGVTFDWSRSAVTGISNAAATGTDNPNEVLLNTTADPITVTYVYTLTANSCSHVQNVDVVVKPTPVLSSTLTPTAICDSTMFTYTPTSNTLGTTYVWSRPAVAGISNPANADNTNPDEYLDNTTTDPITVSYIYTLTADGCTNEQTVSVVVNPTPVLTTTLTPAPVCNTTLFSYNPASATLGTTFSWSRAAVLGISNAAATGTDNPNEILENTTADPITVEYVYTLTANSCSHVQPVSVVVNPTPVLTTTLVAAPICDSSLFSYSPNSATVGTTFEWSRAAVTGVANATASGTDNPNEYLDNTVTEPVTVTYIYTLTANGCSNTQSVTVAVNPTPVLTSTLLPPAVCDSTLFSYVPTSATTGTTFSWSRASVSGILNTAATGSDNPNEYLKNTTTEPVEVTYVYTLTANGCSHEEVVTVVVNPTPVLTSVLVASPLCDSTLFDYEPSSATLGVSFSWSRAAVAGISNAAASGVGNPMEYLVNTTPDPIDVVYVDTLRAHGCYNTQNVTVTIYPRPRLSSTLTPAAICDSSLFEYTATSATVGTTFVWSRDVVAGISNPANADNTAPIEYLDNTTPLSVPVTYVYTLTANGCTNSENVTVTVYPTPVLSSTLTPSAICDNSLFSYAPTSLTPGTVFTWSRAAITGISNAATSGVGNPNEILNNTTPDPITVIYVDTLVANGCVHTQEVIVVVNPTPVLNSTLTPAAVCDSNNFHYVPTSLTAGTSFAWSRPTITGIANATATGVDSIDEVLDNTTPDPITVVYYNTLTANSCSNVDTVSVVVNPTPRLSSTHTPAAICDSALFTYVPASLTSGTVHTWSRAAVTGIANASATGVGTINETLYNLTVAPLTVIYVDTLTANGCVNTEYILVDVNPTPKITSATAATVCSGAPFSYTATTLTTGTTYTWGRALASGISNAAASGTSATVNEVLNNTTLAPKNTTYTFTLSANGCSQPYNVTVTVNPTPAAPVITTHPSNSLCAGTMYQNFGANIPAPDTVNYRWSAVNAQVYAQGNGRQYSLVNFTTADTTAYVVLTANAPGFTCYSYDTFSVNVAASTAYTPLDVFYVDGQFICADNSVSSYQWGRDAVSNLDSSMYAGEINQNYFTTDVDFTQYYYWVITTKEGCSQKTYVNKPTGVIDINTANESMNVYPNPVEDNITLAVELTDMKDVTAVLTDITGKVISRTTIVNGKTTFGVANLVPGTYMISCYHKGAKVGVSKFVKN